MVGVLFTAATVSSFSFSGPSVAFIARCYFPYPDKRISEHQVYVSDIDGSKRMQVSVGSPRPDQLAWVSKHALCWVEKDAHKIESLVLFDLKKKQRRVLLAGKGFQLVGLNDLFKGNGFPEYDDGKRRYQINETGAKVIGSAKTIPWTRASFDNKWQLPGEPMIRLIGTRANPDTASYEFPYNHFIYIFERGTRRYEWSIESEMSQFYKGDRPGFSFLHSILGGASAGTWEGFYEVDWNSGKLKRLISDTCGISLRKGSDYWSGLEPGRTLSPYGPKKNVWTCEAYVGCLKTGKRWTVVRGLEECYEIAISP